MSETVTTGLFALENQKPGDKLMAKATTRMRKPPAPPKKSADPPSETEAAPADKDGAKAAVNEALINWAAVKRRYQNKRKTNARAIAKHFGLDEQRLREVARERGWRRPDSRRRPRPKTPPTIPERMLEMVDGQLTQLEMRMETDMPDNPEHARKLRDMNQVVARNYPQKQGPADGAPQRASAPTSGEIDAERWRLELVERIKKLKQKLGSPTLMNFPIAESEAMPTIATDSYSIAFGDFNRGYLVVDRMGLSVLRDPFSSKPYVLFYTTKRVGGGVQDFSAIKLLKFGVS